MLAVTVDQLCRAAPAGNPGIIAAIAATSGAVFSKHGISNRNRALGFLSTCLEESQFKTLSENLNYSAERAHEVYPREFPTIESAKPYAYKPQAFADKVYGGRMGNVGGNAGWLYRGQGLDQITGEDNFRLLARLTGLDLVAHPDLVTSPEHMLECAAALFVQYPGILIYCDKGAFSCVWALVGTGRATSSVINLTNHEAALAALQKAIPASLAADTPLQEYERVASLDQGEPVITHSVEYEQRVLGAEPAAPIALPAAFAPRVARLDAVKGALAQVTPTAAHDDWLATLEGHVAAFFGKGTT